MAVGYWLYYVWNLLSGSVSLWAAADTGQFLHADVKAAFFVHTDTHGKSVSRADGCPAVLSDAAYTVQHTKYEKGEIKMQLLEGGKYKKTTFVRDIIQGKYQDDKFAELFYLESVTYNSNDNGTRWQNAVLRDVTGRIEGKVWAERIRPEYEKYTGTVVLVQGRYTSYEGRPDLTIDKMEEALYYETADYIEVISSDSRKRAYEWLEKIIPYIEEPFRKLVDELFDSRMLEKLAELPLGEKGAYAYTGGLLTYTSEVAARTYNELRIACLVKPDPSLALTGALTSRIASAKMLERKGIFYTGGICPAMAGGDFYTHQILWETEAFHNIDERSKADLMHILNAASGKVPPGTVEAQLVKAAVENTLFIGSYKADFAEYDKRYLCNMSQNISSATLGRRIYRRKERENEITDEQNNR